MLYTNYKQVARLVLKSEDAVKTSGGLPTIDGNPILITSLYTFKPNLPFYSFTKNTKLAVESFTFNGGPVGVQLQYIGDVIIKNLKRPNIYHSRIQQGTCIFSGNMHSAINYYNNDIINKSIDITGSTNFLNGNDLEIFINTRLLNDTSVDVKGCVDSFNWSLTLVVYEEEKEENPKDYVDDRTNNFSKPSLY
jgi:hypothetical protein